MDERVKEMITTLKRLRFCVFWTGLNKYLDDYYLEYNLESLINLPDHANSAIYSGEGDNGWFFTNSEEELITAFDKKDDFWVGEAWEEMSIETLTAWYDFIFKENGLGRSLELPFDLDILS